MVGGPTRNQFSILNGTFNEPFKALETFLERLGLDIDPLWLFSRIFPGVVR